VVQPKGTIEAIGPGVIVMAAGAGQFWQLRLTPKSKVQVRGTATASVLAPGQYVAFSADVDKRRGAIDEKVARLTIFTPSEQRMVGVFPSQEGLGPGVPAPGVQAPGVQAPGLGPGNPAQPLGGQGDAGLPVDRFDIAAQIRGVAGGKLTLYAPNPYFRALFEVELAEAPEIALELAGLNYIMLAKKGDKIEGRGVQLAPNVVQLSEVTIELSQPLGQQQQLQQKRPARRPRRSSRRGRRERAEEQTPLDQTPVGQGGAAPELQSPPGHDG